MTDLNELAGQVLASEVRIEDALKSITPGLERETVWQAAWDRRDPNPSKNYGIHGVEVSWIVKGPKGGICWSIFTHWMLPHVTREAHNATQRLDVSDVALRCRYEPTGAGIEYHSIKQRYKGQEQRTGCLLVPGGVCYSDTAFTAGDDLLKLLIEQGGEAVWKDLESRYADLPEPEATS